MNQEKLTFIRENAPCYLYDKQQIIERCRFLRSLMPEELFLYSIKANPFRPVVEVIAGEGLGADAASANEALLAEQAGISYASIFYSAPGKTLGDIEKVWGKCTVIADSFSELHLLERLAAERRETVCVGVRVNPRFSMNGAAAGPSKFGIEEEQILASVMDFPHLQMAGIHVHLQSQVLDTDVLCGYYRNVYALAERISERWGAPISFINFGSGIGTVYDAARERPLAFEQIARTMEELHRRNERSLRARFVLETGRFLVCNAGTYYTKVVDRKESRGKVFVVVQNAMNGFLRPTLAEWLRQNLGAFPGCGQEPLYTSGGQCAFRVLGKETNPEKVDVVGNLCTSLDVMARDIVLPHMEIGDVLAVSNAGSYGCTLTPQLFAGQEPVKEFLWEK